MIGWLSVVLSLAGACGGLDDRAPGVVETALPATASNPSDSAGTGGTRPGGASDEGAADPDSPLLLPESRVHVGGVGIGETVTRPVQVVNRSSEPVGVRAELWTGEEDGFSIDGGCDAALEPGERCELGVSFSATAPGERMGTVLLTTHRGETVTLELVGEGLAPGSLVASESSFIFGELEVGVGTASHRFVVRNGGGTATGPLQIVLLAEGEFLLEHDCPESLGPGASCNLDATFAPTTAGPRNGFITISEGGVRLPSLGMHGVGLARVTVTTVGQGRVSAEGLACDGDTCSGLYYPAVTLQAEPTSGWFFTGFAPARCGANSRCVVRVDGGPIPIALTANFREMRENLIFGSAERYPANLGGLAAYDATCNGLASAAGINDAAGSAFIAAMSDGTESLRERLGAARGWVTMDGLPFADSVEALFEDEQVLNTVVHNELGASASFRWMTGTEADGSSSDAHCEGWTSLIGETRTGTVAGGPRVWLANERSPCSTIYSILCMGRTRSVPVAVDVAVGKQIWETRTPYLPGSMTPDQKCQGERPAGVAQGVAFVSYTSRPASSVLDPEATYVRPDGVVIGTGAVLATGAIRTGPWLNADGLPGEPGDRIWTGAVSATSVADSNCEDWTTGSMSVVSFAGPQGVSSPLFTSGAVPCSEAHRIYCVEP
jgi:hypothetical protein